MKIECGICHQNHPTQFCSEPGLRVNAEKLGHDFTDWQNRPIAHCNFCHIGLYDPRAAQPCDISEQLKTKNGVRGKFYRGNPTEGKETTP